MVRDGEAVTATLLDCRPELGSQDTADLLSDISATFRDYVEAMKAPSRSILPRTLIDTDLVAQMIRYRRLTTFQHPTPA